MNARSLPSLPPLRRWPEEAFKYEPAHGFFVRLSERNSAHSTAVLADSLGLNGRHPDPQELLAWCLQFPFRNAHYLSEATPIAEGNSILLNGQRFSRQRDWSLYNPRICDACLGYTRYYRNWWDLTVIDRCPIHDRPLLGGDGTAKLHWWCPGVGQTTSGNFLISRSIAPGSSDHDGWDAYVLRRMGILAPRPYPLLDKSDLHQVIDAAELIGRALQFGWSVNAPPRAKQHSQERRDLLRKGFQVMKSGEDGLRRFLHAYLATRRTRGAPTQGQELYGWFDASLREVSESSITSALSAVMNSVAASNGVYRKTARAEGRAGGPITLKELGKTLDVDLIPLRNIAIDLGLARQAKDRRKRHWFNDDAVEQIRAKIESLVHNDEAARLLKITVQELALLKSGGYVKHVMRRSGRYYFDPDRLYDLLRKSQECPEASQMAQRLLNGSRQRSVDAARLLRKLHPEQTCNNPQSCGASAAIREFAVAKNSGNRNRPDVQGVLLGDVAISLGVAPYVVGRLIRAKYLESDRRRGRQYVTRQSLQQFRERYVPAKLYAPTLGCHPRGAYTKLRGMGIVSICEQFSSLEGCFVERADIARVLGEELAGIERIQTTDGKFWNSLQLYFDTSRSSNRLYLHEEKRAKLVSGDRCSRALVELCDNGVWFRVVASRTTSSRMYKSIVPQLTGLLVSWPEASVAHDEGELCISEFICWDLGVEARWPGVFKLIDDRMTRVRLMVQRVRNAKTTRTPVTTNKCIGVISAA